MNIENQKGQALVELALSLVLLFTIIFGITEFGRVLFIKNTLTNAAREGARRASVTPVISPQTQMNTADLKQKVEDCIPFDKTGMEIHISSNGVEPPSPIHGVSTIKVEVSLPFKTVVPLFIPQLSDITLTGEASMLYE